MRIACMVVDVGISSYYIDFNGLCKLELQFDLCKQKYKLGDIIYITLEI